VAQNLWLYTPSGNVLDVGTFTGTIQAPNADVIVGQSVKTFRGAILGQSVVVHQDVTFTHVPFLGTISSQVAGVVP